MSPLGSGKNQVHERSEPVSLLKDNKAHEAGKVVRRDPGQRAQRLTHSGFFTNTC